MGWLPPAFEGSIAAAERCSVDNAMACLVGSDIQAFVIHDGTSKFPSSLEETFIYPYPGYRK